MNSPTANNHFNQTISFRHLSPGISRPRQICTAQKSQVQSWARSPKNVSKMKKRSRSPKNVVNVRERSQSPADNSKTRSIGPKFKNQAQAQTQGKKVVFNGCKTSILEQQHPQKVTELQKGCEFCDKDGCKVCFDQKYLVPNQASLIDWVTIMS